MAEIKHTPGPLKILGKQKLTQIGGFQMIGSPDGRNCPTAYVSKLGDAYLYAAAPELLEALHLARTVIHEDREALFDSVTIAGDASTIDDWDRPHVERLDAALTAIDAAIARAEGRQDGGV